MPRVLELERGGGDGVPRSCSRAIQSEVARRWFLPARTAPASSTAPGVEQELLGERGLTGIRVGDDREGPPRRTSAARSGGWTRSPVGFTKDPS